MKTTASIKVLCTIFIGIVMASGLHGQEVDKKRTAFYVEKGGIGLAYTLNADFMLKNPICGTWSIRVGAGSIGYTLKDAADQEIDLTLVTIPLAANYLIGKNNNFFEAGIGVTPIITDFEGMVTNDFFEIAGFNMAFFGNFGYRYQSLSTGGILRFNWTPVFNKGGLDLGRFGLSAGVSFN